MKSRILRKTHHTILRKKYNRLLWKMQCSILRRQHFDWFFFSKRRRRKKQAWILLSFEQIYFSFQNLNYSILITFKCCFPMPKITLVELCRHVRKMFVPEIMEMERVSLSRVCIVLVFLCTNMIQSLTQVNNMETIINLAPFVLVGLFLTEKKKREKTHRCNICNYWRAPDSTQTTFNSFKTRRRTAEAGQGWGCYCN